MICPQPQCKAWTRVLETRHKYDNEVYRRILRRDRHLRQLCPPLGRVQRPI